MTKTGCPVVGIATLRHRPRPYDDETEVRQVVRHALLAAGLGQKSPSAPLSEIVPEGSSVLLKPNWVSHINFGGYKGDCVVTHSAIIRADELSLVWHTSNGAILGYASIEIASCGYPIVFWNIGDHSSEQVLAKTERCVHSFANLLDFVDFNQRLLGNVEELKRVGESLRLYVQSHHDARTNISRHEDFLSCSPADLERCV